MVRCCLKMSQKRSIISTCWALMTQISGCCIDHQWNWVRPILKLRWKSVQHSKWVDATWAVRSHSCELIFLFNALPALSFGRHMLLLLQAVQRNISNMLLQAVKRNTSNKSGDFWCRKVNPAFSQIRRAERCFAEKYIAIALNRAKKCKQNSDFW